jgi:hypothetical protein
VFAFSLSSVFRATREGTSFLSKHRVILGRASRDPGIHVWGGDVWDWKGCAVPLAGMDSRFMLRMPENDTVFCVWEGVFFVSGVAF